MENPSYEPDISGMTSQPKKAASALEIDLKVERKEDSDSGLDNTSESGQSDEETKRSFSSDSELTEEDGDLPVAPRRKKSGKQNAEKVIDNEKDCHILIVDDLMGCPFRVGVPDENSQVLCQVLSDGSPSDIAIRLADEVAVLEIEQSSHVIKSEFNNNGETVDTEEMPEFFRNLIEGQHVPCDFDVSVEVNPPWLDIEKYKRGQKFAQEHLFCLNYAEMLSLLILFAFKSALKPLIFSGKSHTPFKAFQRYLSTLTRLKSWYEGDLWNPEDPARKNLLIVRGMHKNIYKKLNEASQEELEEKVTLGDERTTELWCPMRETLLDDFRGSCPMPVPGRFLYEVGASCWVNQLDMSITQFGFVGLAVAYPKKFGIHHASDEDLEAFLHMWRVLGHFLGIKDEYNFCNADLQTVRERSIGLIEIALKPAFRDITPDWEHMCRSLIAGINFYVPGVTFEVSIQYLADIAHIHTPRLFKSFSFVQRFLYRAVKFVFEWGFRIRAYRTFNNFLLNKAIKLAQDASPAKLEEWRNKKFSYMDQPGKHPVRE